MNTAFQKYAAALLPFAVLVIGASQTVLHAGFNLQVDIPFAVIVLGAILTFVVRLLPAGWQGGLKTGIAIVTTILSAALPFVLPGTVHLSASVPVVVVAILNALATELGVQIRTNPIDAGTAVPGVPADVSSLPAAAAVPPSVGA
jgi:hypothetical protein